MKRLLTLVLLFLALFVNAQTADDIRSIDGLVAWFSADSVHLTADNHVDTLYDKSGNGFNVVQLSSDAQPTLSENVLNSNPSIVFDGNDYLNGGDVCDLGPDGASIFIVGKSNKNSGCFFAKSLTGGDPKRYAIFYQGGISFIYNNSTFSKPLSFGDYKMLQAFLNPDYSVLSLIANGTRLGEFNINAVDMNSTFDFLVGGYNNSVGSVPPSSAFRLDGEIAEILIFNKYLNNSDSLMVLDYIRNKYSGVQLNIKNDLCIDYGFAPVEYTAVCDWAQSFLWDDGNETPSITISDSKKHFLTVTDNLGFKYSDYVQIKYTIPSLPSDTMFCYGEKSYLDAYIPGEYTFLWSNGSTEPKIEITESGQYKITITDKDGYQWSKTINVSIDEFAKLDLFDNDAYLCEGDTLKAWGNDDYSEYKFLWNTEDTDYKISVKTTGSYSVSVIDSNGCVLKDTTKITIKGVAPKVNIIVDTVHANEETTLTSIIDISANSNITEYKWAFGDGDSASISNPYHIYKKAGTYSSSLTVTEIGGCFYTAYQQVKVLYDKKDLVKLSYPLDGQHIFTDAITVKWKPIYKCDKYQIQVARDKDFNDILVSDTTSITSFFVKNLEIGRTYYWRVRSEAGRFGQSQTFNCISIKQVDGLIAWFSADSVHLTADNHVDTLYDKSGNGFNVVQLSSDAQPTLSENVLNSNPSIVFDGNDYLNGGDVCDLGPDGASIFIVGKSNKNSGCFFAKSLTGGDPKRYAIFYQGGISFIYNNSTFSKPLSFGDYKILQAFLNPDSSLCSLIANGNNIGNINVNAVDMNSNFDFLVGGYNNSSGSVPPYTALGLDGEIAEIIIFNHYLSSADSLMVLNFLRDKYSGVNLHLDDINVNYGFAPVEYTVECDWAQSFVWDDSIVSPTITITDSKPHSLTVTDKFGFTYTDTLKINYQTPSLPTDIFICSGEKATLDATVQGDYTCLWNNGSTQPIIEATNSGIFYVTITDTNGYHWVSNTINVVSDGFSSIKLFGNDTSLCKGDSIAPNLNINSNYSYMWNTNSHECKIAVNTEGRYSITVTNENGCMAKDSIYIGIKGIVPDVEVSADTAFANESTSFKSMVNISDGSQIIEYKWLFGDGDTGFSQNPTHKYKEPGTYSATLAVTTTSGCNGSSALTAKVLYDRNKNISPVCPIDNQHIFTDSVVFKWKPIKDCERYFLQIATSSDFNTLVFSGQTNKTDTTINGFIEGETYYWRIRSIDGTFGPSYMFTVSSLRNINGLVAWFSADSVHLNADNHVDTLYDKSRNRFNVIQTLNDAQPSLKSNAINGQLSISFDGNDFLNGGNICNLGPNGTSIFIVGKSNKGNGCFVAKSKAAGVPNRYAVFYENNLCFLYNNSTLSKPLDFGDYKVLQAFLNPDSSTCSLVVNGNQLGKANTNAVDINNTFDFLIGGYNNGNGTIPPYSSLSLDGEIAEIVIFNRYLNHADSLMVLNYLQDKYSGVNLHLNDISVDYGFAPIEYTAECDWAQSFVWDDGTDTSNIIISDNKKHYLTVTDKFGFKHTDYIQVDYPKIGIISDTTICQGDTITWNPDLSGPYYYKWSDGSTGKELTIANEGKYWVVITDTAGYEWHSDTVAVKVDMYANRVTLGNDTIPACVGNNIYLQTGFEETVGYLWSDGTTADHIAVKESGSYAVTTTDSIGCKARKSAYINVVGIAPTPDFTFSAPCATRAIDFTDKSHSNDNSAINTYEWTFGDGTTSNITNPTHTYKYSGNYSLQLAITCSNGCNNVLKQIVHIDSLPKADFAPTQCCSFTSTQFTDHSVTADSYISSWLWTMNDTTYTERNPQTTYNTYGEQNVSLTVTTAHGCTDTLNRTINVKQGPKVDFTYSPACINTPIYFTNKTNVAFGLATNYIWTKDTTKFSSQRSPATTFNDTGIYIITLTANQIANNCTSSVSKDINIRPRPRPAIIANDICNGQASTLTGSNNEPRSKTSAWIWNIDDTLPAENGTHIRHQFATNGKHKVMLTIIDSMGCTNSFDTTINVHNTPSASFHTLQTRGPVPFDAEFINNSEEADNYIWHFGDGEQSTETDACHTYNYEDAYNVQLIARNDNCADTATRTVTAINPHSDITLVSASAETSNGFISVKAVVANRSNFDIADIDIEWHDNIGHHICETISDTIKENKILQYQFGANIGEAMPSRLEYICVSAQPSSRFADEEPSDNEYCIILNNNEFTACTPKPNPASSKLEIGFIVPDNHDVKIELLDSKGEFISTLYDGPATTGFNSHAFNISRYSSGVYFYRIIHNGQFKSQKIIIDHD